ncbi:MAG: hypothetical protein ABR573_01275, partial [Candidatus Dormibacteria bacterium]
MRRLVRVVLVLAVAMGLAGIVGLASSYGPAPTITGLSAHVVSPSQDLVVSGYSFSSDQFPNDCASAVGGLPTVHFAPLNGAPVLDAQPAGSDREHCTDYSVHVAVPGGFTGAARVSLTDPSGQPSNNNMVVTLVPQAGLSPSAGQTGVTSSLRGSGLRPPTLAVVNGS